MTSPVPEALSHRSSIEAQPLTAPRFACPLKSPPSRAKVHFTVTAVQDNSRKLGDWRARGVSFDLERYKEQVGPEGSVMRRGAPRLHVAAPAWLHVLDLLPHQAFNFSCSRISQTNLFLLGLVNVRVKGTISQTNRWTKPPHHR